MSSPASNSPSARPRLSPGGPAWPKMTPIIKTDGTNPPREMAVRRAAAISNAVSQTVRQLGGNGVVVRAEAVAARPKVTPDDPARPRMSPVSKSVGTNPPRSGSGEEVLSPRQLAAARAMVSGKTVGRTVRELGIARRTLFRWRQQPAFAVELQRLHERLALNALGKESPLCEKDTRPMTKDASCRTFRRGT